MSDSATFRTMSSGLADQELEATQSAALLGFEGEGAQRNPFLEGGATPRQRG